MSKFVYSFEDKVKLALVTILQDVKNDVVNDIIKQLIPTMKDVPTNLQNLIPTGKVNMTAKGK